MHTSTLDALLAAETGWQARSPGTGAAFATPLPSRCEVAIVGAGLTGLSAALTAAEAGCSVVLLEAGTVGGGATGRNSGFVVPVPARADPAALRAWLGAGTDAYLTGLGAASAALLAYPEANAVRNGWMQMFAAPVAAPEHAWRELGVRARALDADEARALTGAAGYHGGLLFEEGGQIDPLALARGLAERCRRLGVVLVEHCRVLAIDLESAGGLHAIDTAQGSLRARRVLLAGNAYSQGGVSAVARQSIPLALALGQFDLAAADQGRILPADIPFSDNRRDMWFFRKTPEGRLLTGLFALSSSMPPPAYVEQLRQRIDAVFGVQLDHVPMLWAGRVGLTPSGQPNLRCLRENVLSWTGCNGRGLALSYLMGQTLVRQLLGQGPAPLPFMTRPLRGRALLTWMAERVIARDRRQRSRARLSSIKPTLQKEASS